MPRMVIFLLRSCARSIYFPWVIMRRDNLHFLLFFSTFSQAIAAKVG